MAGKKSFEEARRFLRAPQEAARELGFTLVNVAGLALLLGVAALLF